MSPESATLLAALLARAKRAGADAADAALFVSTDLSVSRRLGRPEDLERSESRALGLRVMAGRRQATVSSTDSAPETLDEMAARAVAMARLAPEDPHAGLAPAALLAANPPDLDLCDPREPSVEWLLERCAEAEDAALATKGITNSEGAGAGYSRSDVALVTSHGFAGNYRGTSASISLSVLAGEGAGMERDYDFTSARHVSDLEDARMVGERAARRALDRLGARKIQSRKASVLFDPRVGKGLLSTFAGAINGAAVARGTTFLKDRMGEAVFSPGITVVDDPHIARGRASKPFDGEGVAGKKRALAENGILKSWLLDARSAHQLGLETTGHAARGVASPPSPAPSNLYLEAGALSPGALMEDIREGFYVTETFGMGVNIVTGDYSQGASGFWIENGKRAYPVSEVTIAGRLPEMFRQLTPANDLEFRYGINTPTLRIDGMTVGGK